MRFTDALQEFIPHLRIRARELRRELPASDDEIIQLIHDGLDLLDPCGDDSEDAATSAETLAAIFYAEG